MSKKKHKNKRPQPRPNPNPAAPAVDEAIVGEEAIEEEDLDLAAEADEQAEPDQAAAIEDTPAEGSADEAPVEEVSVEVVEPVAEVGSIEEAPMDTIEEVAPAEDNIVIAAEPIEEMPAEVDAVAGDQPVVEDNAAEEAPVEVAIAVEDAPAEAPVADAEEPAAPIEAEPVDAPAEESAEDAPADSADAAEDEGAEGEEGVTLTEEERKAAEEEALRRKEEARIKEEKRQKREAHRAKVRAWAKKHVAFIVVTSLIVAILLGLTAGFLIVTRNMAFVKDAASLDKALAKDKEVVLTADFTYSQDIDDGVSFNLNGHTLTVEGNVKLTAEQGYIGSKAHPWATVGNKGGLKCNALTLSGNEWTLCGNIDTPTVTYSDEGVLTMGGTVTGTIALADQSNLALYGTVATIKGGTVTAYGGSHATAAQDSVELVLYAGADVATFDTANYFYVYTLDAPSVWVEDNGDVYTCVIAGAAFAKQYRIIFAGEEKATLNAPVQGQQLTYDLPSDVAPGTYNLQVVALNADKENHSLFEDSAPTSLKVKYYADLAQPTINVVKEDEKYYLVILPVENATQFAYSINGAKAKTVNAAKEGNTKVDITAELTEVGNYLITVVAKHPKSNYNDSQKASFTQLIQYQLTAPEVAEDARLQEGVLRFDAAVDANTTCLLVEVVKGNDILYKAQCGVQQDGAYAIALPEGKDYTNAKVRIAAVGTRYYTDSTVVVKEVLQ